MKVVTEPHCHLFTRFTGKLACGITWVRFSVAKQPESHSDEPKLNIFIWEQQEGVKPCALSQVFTAPTHMECLPAHYTCPIKVKEVKLSVMLSLFSTILDRQVVPRHENQSACDGCARNDKTHMQQEGIFRPSAFLPLFSNTKGACSAECRSSAL